MADSNPTRVRYAENKNAFDEVIGDPYAIPEPIEGEYYRRKKRTSIKIFDAEAIGATKNNAKPNSSDFFADVENIVEEVITNKINRKKFWRTYMEDVPELGQQERNLVEQALGKKFRLRRLSPVAGYFRTVRRKIGETKVAAPLKG